MSLVKPLFVASITSLTLMMINTSSNINLLQQMGIPPTLGTCSNWCLLMYEFCNSHHTYNTVAKETFLPQEGCKETHLSRNILFPTALHDES